MARRTAIMVHGAFCGGWAFEAFRQPFEAAGYDVVAPDLKGRGAGQSPAGLSMADYADQIAGLVRAAPTPPVLVGHSLGGLVAQMAAARARVAALVLLAPSAPWGVAGGSLEEAVSAVSLYALGPFWMQAIDPDYASARHYSLDRLDKAARKRVFAQMAPESGRALWETLNWWLDPFLTTQVPAGRIGAPVLALVGERDLIHPPPTVRQTAERLGGETRVLAGMSHWLPSEPGWDMAAKTCLDWLDALDAVSAA
jgi:pimeloyl-ACP methyl ester carboxylesterase